MIWLFISLGLLLLIAFLIVAAKKNQQSSGGVQAHHYVKKDALLTVAERSFLGVLEQAIGNEYRVYAQVRLADILSVRPGLSKALRTTAQNKINAKHADFILCDKDTLEILCAIELDDASHARASRKARDAFLEEACKAAALPLARFPAKSAYSVHELRSSILGVLGHSDEDPAPTIEQPQAQVTAETENTGASTAAPACPKCGATTLMRTVKSGAHAGKKLWGCSAYPTCRGWLQADA